MTNTSEPDRARTAAGIMLAGITALTLAGCTSLGSSGPSRSTVQKAGGANYADAGVVIVELNDKTVRHLAGLGRARSFAEVFGPGLSSPMVFGQGDLVEVSIWEAPPATLFGSESVAGAGSAYGSVTRATNLPAQMVGDDGTISIPFIGALRVVGLNTSQVERTIRSRLAGKAHDPQAIVRLVQNETRNVTVLGEVTGSRRVPLSSRGERLLDVIAAVGGPRQPVDKTSVQISRDGKVASMALEGVIFDPAQNVRMLKDDIVTVLHQPFSFIALGAVARNAEIPFEGRGLSLSQALGRMGGLKDERADIRGVFIFRFEQPEALAPNLAQAARRTAEGLVPVIYRLDLGDATGLFAAQDFAVRDKDVIYVSTAPAADLPKFLTTLSSVAFTTIGIVNLVK